MNVDLKVKAIKKIFINYFGRSFKLDENDTIIDESLPKGVFTFTFGSTSYESLVGLKELPKDNYIFIQRCFRTDTNYKIGNSDYHQTTFLLGGIRYFINVDSVWFFLTILDFLEECGISRRDLKINLSKESCLDQELIGVFSSNCKISLLPKDSLILQVNNCPFKGERIELVYSKKQLELWNISFIYHKDGLIVDGGFSLERIAVINSDLNSIFELDPYHTIKKLVQKLYPKISRITSNYIADIYVAIKKAIDDGAPPSAKGRGNKIRYLIKKVCARLRFFSEDFTLFSSLYLNNNKKIIDYEIKIYQQNYEIALEYFNSYLDSIDVFDLDDFYENHSKKNGTKLFNTPKLLNEEMMLLACSADKAVKINETLCKRYDIPLEYLGVIVE